MFFNPWQWFVIGLSDEVKVKTSCFFEPNHLKFLNVVRKKMPKY
jgi:hypothetical protein